MLDLEDTVQFYKDVYTLMVFVLFIGVGIYIYSATDVDNIVTGVLLTGVISGIVGGVCAFIITVCVYGVSLLCALDEVCLKLIYSKQLASKEQSECMDWGEVANMEAIANHKYK